MTAREEWKRRQRRTGGIVILVVGFSFLAAGIFVMMLSRAVMNDPGVRLQMAFSQDASLRVALVNGLSLGGGILGGAACLQASSSAAGAAAEAPVGAKQSMPYILTGDSGLERTGRTSALPGITLLRFQGSRGVERWSQADFLGLMAQLGPVTLPGEPLRNGPPIKPMAGAQGRRGSGLCWA